MKLPFLCLLALIFVVEIHSATDPSLVAHEWGTITSHHFPDGRSAGRLNRISATEVLPDFVHKFEPPETSNHPEQVLGKSTMVPGRPDVIMRLETPVIYFYPSAKASIPSPFEVNVRFRGGIVNEFYPNATASVELDYDRIQSKMGAGILKNWDGNVLNNYVIGSLRWNEVQLAKNLPLPKTSNPVWLSPRKVLATSARASGESEKYLFYRGVAHLDALMQTQILSNELILRTPRTLHWLNAKSMVLSGVWFVGVREDGAVAFRTLGKKTIARTDLSKEIARTECFQASDYTKKNLDQLQDSLKNSLITTGLFKDEAEAMLATWDHSYFKSPGMRVFYVVPAEWLHYFLPLQISTPHQLTRAFIGRIDLLQDPAKASK